MYPQTVQSWAHYLWLQEIITLSIYTSSLNKSTRWNKLRHTRTSFVIRTHIHCPQRLLKQLESFQFPQRFIGWIQRIQWHIWLTHSRHSYKDMDQWDFYLDNWNSFGMATPESNRIVRLTEGQRKQIRYKNVRQT